MASGRVWAGFILSRTLGFILYSRENKEGFYFGSKGYPLEEKGVCLQRGTVDTGNRGDFLYNNRLRQNISRN